LFGCSVLRQPFVSRFAFASRSVRTVRIRAISRLASFSRAVLSRAPVAPWKRRLKSSCRLSASCMSSSSSVRSLKSLARKEIRLPFHDSRLDRQLPAREPERLLRQWLGHTGELEHDAPRLDHRDPVLRRALSRAHPGLSRLLRDRLVREDVDPDLAATADLARHRDSGRLDLPVRHPAVLKRLQAEVARLHPRLALREAAAAATLIFAVFRLLRKQHLDLVALLVVLLRRALGGGLCLGRGSLLRRRLPRGLRLLGALTVRLVERDWFLRSCRVRRIGSRR